MANRYCDNKESSIDPHSIPVFSRPFLEYSKSYPSPSKQGASPEASGAGVLFSSATGMCRYPNHHPLEIAAIQHGNEKGGFSAPVRMRLLALCASFPDRAITLPAEALDALVIAYSRRIRTRSGDPLGQHPILWPLFALPWMLVSEKRPFLLPEKPVYS